MIALALRLAVALFLFELCHVAAVHGFAASLLGEAVVQRFDIAVESVAGAILLTMATRPGRW